LTLAMLLVDSVIATHQYDYEFQHMPNTQPSQPII